MMQCTTSFCGTVVNRCVAICDNCLKQNDIDSRAAAERRVAVLEGLLKEAQETIQRSYCTPLRADVVARIDAALGDKGGGDDGEQ